MTKPRLAITDIEPLSTGDRRRAHRRGRRRGPLGLASWRDRSGRASTVVAGGLRRAALLAPARRGPGRPGPARSGSRPGTVVTPLARDLLKRQGIAIRLVSSVEAAMAAAARRMGLRDRDASRVRVRRCGGPCSTRTRLLGSSSTRRRRSRPGWPRTAPAWRAGHDRRGVGRGLEGVPARRGPAPRRVGARRRSRRAVRSTWA